MWRSVGRRAIGVLHEPIDELRAAESTLRIAPANASHCVAQILHNNALVFAQTQYQLYVVWRQHRCFFVPLLAEFVCGTLASLALKFSQLHRLGSSTLRFLSSVSRNNASNFSCTTTTLASFGSNTSRFFFSFKKSL